MKDVDKLINDALDAHAKGNLEEARNLYIKTLQITPSNSKALAWLGTLEAMNKNFEYAISLIQKALKIEPHNSSYLANLASVLCECNLNEEALNNINTAIFLESKNSIFIKNRAVININLKNYSDAIKDIERAKELEGGNSSEMFLIMGNALLGLGRTDEALASYDNSIKKDKYNYEAYLNKGNILAKNKNKKKAIDAYISAININNNYSEAYAYLASSYLDMDNLDSAEYYCIKALNTNPKAVHAINIYGLIKVRQSKFSEALDYFNTILKDYPREPNANYNKSLVLMRLGNYCDGLPLYEWRWKTKEFEDKYKILNKPLWLGIEDINGKKILVHCEQGLGDTIQYVRYLEQVSKLGAYIIFQVPVLLHPLMRGISGVNKLISTDCNEDSYDFHCPLMSLPLAIGLGEKPSPYLNIDSSSVHKWKNYIGDDGFKIAICWQGNNSSEVDIGRSFGVEFFSKISSIENIRLISLQKNRLQDDTANLKDLSIEELPKDFDTSNGAFIDSAAIMKCVDLVITSDTALTHLAGALGVKTFLLLQKVPDWRWGQEADDTVWYPNHKLFRQSIRGDWAGVFNKLKIEVEKLIRANPISI